LKYTENKLLIILLFIIILLSNSGFSYPLIKIGVKNPEINYNFNNLKPGDIIFFHDSGFDDDLMIVNGIIFTGLIVLCIRVQICIFGHGIKFGWIIFQIF